MQAQHNGRMTVALVNVMDSQGLPLTGIDFRVMRLEGIFGDVCKLRVRRTEYFHGMSRSSNRVN
jgi:hypothetical protein